MANQNWAKIFAKKRERENRIKKICPNMENVSGIYVFHKIDEEGFKGFYSGQARHLIERTSSHLGEYDHIANSLKNHGFKKDGKPFGWELDYEYCSEEELDIKEKETIKHWHIDLGYMPYNKTSGSQGIGKFGINRNAPSKGYLDGLKQGEINSRRMVADWFNKHLKYDYKTKETVNSKKAYDRFTQFIDLSTLKEEISKGEQE